MNELGLTAALYAVGAVLLVGALVNAIGPKPLREQYRAWGYPPAFRWVTAALEALAVALLISPETRGAGLLLGAVVMMGAIATLVRAREYTHTIPAALVLIASVACLAWR